MLSSIVLASLVISGCFLISVDSSGALSIDIDAAVYAYDATFDFGPVDPAAGPATVTAGIVNITERNVTVTALSVNNVVFAVETPALPATIAAGESAEVSLSFDPENSENLEGILSVTIDRADIPFVLNLRGEGNYAPVAEVIVNVTGGIPDMTGIYELSSEPSPDGYRVYAVPDNSYTLYGMDAEGYPRWHLDTDLDDGNGHLCEYASSRDGLSAPSVPSSDWSPIDCEVAPDTVGEIGSPSAFLMEDDTVTANYRYSDAEGDPAGTPLYQWYRSDTADPTGSYTAITGAASVSYTLVFGDVERHLQVLVTPLAQNGTSPGQPVILGPGPRVYLLD